MAFFGFGKKGKVIDLGERYRKTSEAKKGEASNSFNVLGNAASGSYSGSSGSFDAGEFSGSTEENRKKLVKRLLDITTKLDEITTQIYHLQQRVELLERKTGVGQGHN